MVRIGGNSSGGFQDGWEGQGGNGPYVEEEDIELGFEHLLSDLRQEIIARLCESADSKAQVVFDGDTCDQTFMDEI